MAYMSPMITHSYNFPRSHHKINICSSCVIKSGVNTVVVSIPETLVVKCHLTSSAKPCYHFLALYTLYLCIDMYSEKVHNTKLPVSTNSDTQQLATPGISALRYRLTSSVQIF